MRHHPGDRGGGGRLTALRGRVLVIAGSDSGGGAGIQADVKAVMAMGAYAATAVTAITAQNTRGVHAIHPVPPEIVAAQIEAVLSDIGADAIKIGMLGDVATVQRVAAALAATVPLPLVVDPVMVAKGGASLLADDAVQTMRRDLIPLASLLTPNLPEAAALLGREVTDPAEVASALLTTGARAVLLKGGHADGESVTDLLADADGTWSITRPRIATRHTHGTGCTLASAIAAGLAQRLPLRDAITRARDYVQAAIQTAPGFGQGHGPLNHNALVR